jgi:hypothetical protein
MTPLKANTIISFILLFVLLTLSVEAMPQRRKRNLVSNVSIADTQKIDTLKNDSLALLPAKKKQPLAAPVVYEANDSIVFTKGGYAHLYGQGKVNYEKIELAAQVISMNMDSSTVYAHGVPDSLGVMQGTPVFKDGDTPYETKTIRYNFKSKRGFISNVVSQQGEGYVTGNNAKKGVDDELFMVNGRYTTCDHHDHPHFYLQLTRAKVRPKKNVITGPAYLVVEDVPLPIAVPFFFFPFSSSYSSGIIMPTYMDDSSRGFGLTDGGYYFAINDNMDLKVLGDIYTKGSWTLGVASTYNRRYKYSGTLQANYQVTKTGDKNMSDYLVQKDFKIVWSHKQDSKASPNTTFSASVNYSSTSYERTNINNLYNSSLLSQNTKTSSVAYSRSFPDQNLTISSTANISQTLKDSSVSVTFPDLNIALSSIYPFKRKNAVGDERWYEKISLSYTGRLENSIDTKNDLLFKSNLVKDWTNGMSHTIPVSATFSLFKYLNVTPSLNYTERWYTNKIMRGWDSDEESEIDTDTIYGFYRVYNYSASLGINTKLYGMYKPLFKFAKNKEVQIRHVITPQVSFSMAPDFGSSRYGYYANYSYVNSNNETKVVKYSPFSEGLFGYPSDGRQGTVSFSLTNNLEMKYKAKNDSIRKVSLIDALTASISYNMAAETKPWSDLSTSLRLKLSKNYTFSMSSSFATYAYQFDEDGDVYEGNRTEWSYGRFGRFQGWGSSFNYTLNNDTWKKLFGPKDEKVDDKKNGKGDAKKPESGDVQGEGEDTKTKKVEKAKVDADGYQVFAMPWSLNLSYSFNISENTSAHINEKTMRYPYKYTQTLSASGSIKISNRWNMSFTSGYDFDAHKITQSAFTVSRDLHCWNMSASISPIGTYKYYNFTIRANASLLQDLKWEQRSQTQSNIQWY